MTFPLTRRALHALAACLALCASAPAFADHTVKVVVPFAAGGTQDLVARVIAPALSKALDASVIVENRAGAGGTIGMAYVANSAGDGRTMALVSSSHHINAALYPKVSYDAVKSFAPAAHIGKTGFALMVSAAVPARNVAEFVAYAKANPGKLNYASAGNGSATHLGMAYLCAVAGLQMQHIPFKATGEALNEVLSGRVQAIMPASIGALAYLDDPRIRVLGLTSPVGREGALARLKTLSESGVPQFNYDSWYGLLLPATTPAATVEKINQAVARVLADPAVVAALDKAGIVPIKMSTAEFKAFAAKDAAEMRQLVQVSGAKVE
ncbi:tripartite tricarboxylate transporter substrate-binding protein [Variovorax sp.]|uniref:tripartite tricarboxylate transporter substrate-binding protein n=1 Tax=Variovorax sp. TaxID=1871043 RepID=UPI00137F817F|nr:tripartite tricarboxylate transporter substrate-binding protein [Variovorax sp.]KAF1066508.1 MAG: hypothetical protein GAK39_04853 [Variovorax sp.]